MNYNDDPGSAEDNIRLIGEMIQTAKQEQKDNGAGWILWGWMIFLASAASYLNLQYRWVSSFYFWNLFGFISLTLMAIDIVRGRIKGKQAPVRTYAGDLLQKLNIGFTISLVMIILSMNIGGGPEFDNLVPPPKGFALLLVLYGFWMLIYGAVLSFRPSLIGAYITWAIALASLFVQQFETTMLLHALAVLCGYIIPGHMAYRAFKTVPAK